jgi:hypothetical protein
MRLLMVTSLVVSLAAVMMTSMPTVFAQTQYVTATPGYINLGMTTTVTVTAPAAGTYTLVVQPPSGTPAQVSLTFSAAGQTQTTVFGDPSSGFKTPVSQAGTYNVFLQQGSQAVSSASFYATNQLAISFQFLTAGTCAPVVGVTRGGKLIPAVIPTFASNGAEVTPTTDNATKGGGLTVTITMPDGTKSNAAWDSGASLWRWIVTLPWNYTSLGNWSPAITASDGFGNKATFTYSGTPFPITPAQLSTAIQLTDAKTNQLVTGLYSGQSINIQATISYSDNLNLVGSGGATYASSEPTTGFIGPLSTTRGGVAQALVGWGYFNATTHAFNPSSAKSPGGLISTVPLTFKGNATTGAWTGTFTAASLPSLPAGTTYEVVVSSADGANPPNTGLGELGVPAATVQTATAVSTPTATAVSTALSTVTQTVAQMTSVTPTWAYGAMVVLLIVGLGIGYVMRRPKPPSGKP